MSLQWKYLLSDSHTYKHEQSSLVSLGVSGTDVLPACIPYPILTGKIKQNKTTTTTYDCS